MIKKTIRLFMTLLMSASLLACNHPQLMQQQISKPDEYKKIYEAKEKVVLAAVAAAVAEKEMGGKHPDRLPESPARLGLCHQRRMAYQDKCARKTAQLEGMRVDPLYHDGKNNPKKDGKWCVCWIKSSMKKFSV